jgi:prepilin-type N-terminal cleavage/methylation domain-containing protein
MKTPNANGFSLIEVTIATVVLAIGMLAMAASTGYVAAELRNATWNSQRGAAREQIVEELRATPFDNVVNSTSARVIGRFRLSWTVISVNNHLKRISIVAQGPSYQVGKGPIGIVTDTAIVNMARP